MARSAWLYGRPERREGMPRSTGRLELSFRSEPDHHSGRSDLDRELNDRRGRVDVRRCLRKYLV